MGFLFGKKDKKFEINGVRYKVDAEKPTAEVTRSPNAAGDVVILSEVDGKIITKIGNSAFARCKGITSVSIPNSISCIGYSAFKGCKGLTGVCLPKNVTSISSGSFADCTNLKHISKQ